MTVEQNQTPETQSLQQRLEQMAAAEWPAGRLNRKPVNRIFPIRETADAK